MAPYDAILSQHDVVQPDLVFVSEERRHLITESNLQGAPDLAVEVVSPASRERDFGVKRKLYAQFGVREHWLVDPGENVVEVYSLGLTGSS